MPFIKIESLAASKKSDLRKVIRELANDFSSSTGIALEHINIRWHTIESGNYYSNGEIGEIQNYDSMPMLVEVFAPDFNSEAKIEMMFEVIATSLAKHCDIAKENVTINFRAAHSGQFYESGKIERW